MLLLAFNAGTSSYIWLITKCFWFSANHEKKLVGEKLLDYKLDGVRVLAIYDADSDSVTMYSRNGKQFINFGHIEKEIVDTLAKLEANASKSFKSNPE